MKPSIRLPRRVRPKSKPRLTLRRMKELFQRSRQSVEQWSRSTMIKPAELTIDFKSRRAGDANWREEMKSRLMGSGVTAQMIIARSAEEARRFQRERLTPNLAAAGEVVFESHTSVPAVDIQKDKWVWSNGRETSPPRNKAQRTKNSPRPRTNDQ